MHQNSFLFQKEPHWKNNHPGIKQTLPANVQSWVYELNSLTRRLRSHYGQTLAVEILFHHWRSPFLSECLQLNIAHQRYNLIREVVLHADGQPLILARTILPQKTIKFAKRNLSHLGNRPLGEVIFSYPQLERKQLNISCLKANEWSQALNKKIQVSDQVWGRRTLYAIHHQPLLVSEFFLEGALALTQK